MFILCGLFVCAGREDEIVAEGLYEWVFGSAKSVLLRLIVILLQYNCSIQLYNYLDIKDLKI